MICLAFLYISSDPAEEAAVLDLAHRIVHDFLTDATPTATRSSKQTQWGTPQPFFGIMF